MRTPGERTSGAWTGGCAIHPDGGDETDRTAGNSYTATPHNTQASEMSQKYEQPAMAVRRAAGLYTCPLCGKRTQVGHTHCHWCGKKLSWDREAYTDRDYPHMSTKGGRRR